VPPQRFGEWSTDRAAHIFQLDEASIRGARAMARLPALYSAGGSSLSPWRALGRERVKIAAVETAPVLYVSQLFGAADEGVASPMAM
jgi:hypothetical protein